MFEKRRLKQAANKFDQQRRFVRVALCTDIFNFLNNSPLPEKKILELLNEPSFCVNDLSAFKELNKYLAAQAVNYILGEDLEQSYENLNGFQKQYISSLAQLVPETLIAFFNQDELSRKMVVFIDAYYTILMEQINGSQFLASEDAQRKINIVETYKNNILVNQDSINDIDVLFNEYYNKKCHLFDK